MLKIPTTGIMAVAQLVGTRLDLETYRNYQPGKMPQQESAEQEEINLQAWWCGAWMEMRCTWENRGWHLCPLRIITSPTSVNLWYAFKHSGFSYFTCVHWFIVFMESQGQPIPVIAPVSLVEWPKSTGSLDFHGRPQAHLCHWPCLPIAATPKSRIGQRCRAMLQFGRGRQLKDATKIWRKQQEASFEPSHNKALSIECNGFMDTSWDIRWDMFYQLDMIVECVWKWCILCIPKIMFNKEIYEPLMEKLPIFSQTENMLQLRKIEVQCPKFG